MWTEIDHYVIVIVFDELELIVHVIQGLSKSTANPVITY